MVDRVGSSALPGTVRTHHPRGEFAAYLFGICGQLPICGVLGKVATKVPDRLSAKRE